VTDTVPTRADSMPCAGARISEIDINTLPPSFGPAAGIWRFAQNVAGRHHEATQNHVVESFLSIHPGQMCTRLALDESERVLRAQPFLARANITTAPDTGGTVRVNVETEDEIPAIIGGRMSGSGIESLTLGDANLGGNGLRLEGSVTRGHAYRTGFGARFVDYGAFGFPITLNAEGNREPLGHVLAVGIAYPFYTDLQKAAWQANVRDDRQYVGIIRPAKDPLALPVQSRRWNAGGLGRFRLGAHVGIIGALVSGIDIRPGTEGIVVSDSGFVADTGSALAGRYARFRVTRPAVLAGARIVRYVRAIGFNTLTGTEDLPSGLQAGVLVGRGFQPAGERDLYLATSLFAGHATTSSFLGAQLELETRRTDSAGRFDDVIASGRGAWYLKHSETSTLVLSDELSAGWRAQLPLQLTFGSYDGGLRGYRGTWLAGARRNVVRAEQRWVLGSPFHRADIGFAGFADGGTLWAGDAPYGRTVPFRASVGVSVLAAFPSGSKRLLRADFAVPTTHEGNGRWELRFTYDDLTRRFWREPGDVARARTGATPSSLFTWPSR
jgi:hypothetical protein